MQQLLAKPLPTLPRCTRSLTKARRQNKLRITSPDPRCARQEPSTGRPEIEDPVEDNQLPQMTMIPYVCGAWHKRCLTRHHCDGHVQVEDAAGLLSFGGDIHRCLHDRHCPSPYRSTYLHNYLPLPRNLFYLPALGGSVNMGMMGADRPSFSLRVLACCPNPPSYVSLLCSG